jgi:prevent-host-death family protein
MLCMPGTPNVRGLEAQMQKRERKTLTLNVTETRQQFSQLLNQVYRGEVRVVVEKNGIPVAALVTMSDAEVSDREQERRERAFAVIDEIREAFKDVPQDELDRMVEQAIAEVRAQNRASSDQSVQAA